MFGLIGQAVALPGRRDALVAILLEGSAGMPGCLSDVVAHDTADADAVPDHRVVRIPGHEQHFHA